MRVIHFSSWSPRRSGLYECTKDQIKFERKYGIDSQMALFDAENPKVDIADDGWLKPISWDEAKVGDIHVIHRGLPTEFEKPEYKRKTCMVIHGTVEFLMLEEVYTDANKTPFNSHINLIRNCDSCVAVNPHDYDIYKLYDPEDKLSMIHDAIDVDRFTIKGYKHPYMCHPQIIFADSLRVNKHPAHAIWAMAEIVKQIPTAKLTIVGLDLGSILTWRNILLRSPNRHLAENVELCQLMTTEMRPYFRGADILINGNMSGVPSRVELEAMACGCQVVSYNGPFTPWIARPFDIKDIAAKVIDAWKYIQENPMRAKFTARNWVAQNANMEIQVKDKFIPLYNKLLGK